MRLIVKYVNTVCPKWKLIVQVLYELTKQFLIFIEIFAFNASWSIYRKSHLIFENVFILILICFSKKWFNKMELLKT